MKKILLILISILTLSSQTMAYEEANYEIINENNNYEIRKYFDRLVIETNTTQGNGFKKLFNYISGNNEQKKEIKMTVPVTQEIKNGNMTMQFYLPSKFKSDDQSQLNSVAVSSLNSHPTDQGSNPLNFQSFCIFNLLFTRIENACFPYKRGMKNEK